MRSSRILVGVLAGIAALLAFMVGAFSLTRIAGDYLGFPPGMEWTFTGAVDVAGIAGGVMWTAFTGQVRRIGKPMNIVCTIVSGVGVGMDHATHAGRALRVPGAVVALPGSEQVWPVAAFVAGVFMPALVAWILHALAVIADRQTASAGNHQSDRQADRQRQAGDRQSTSVVVASTARGDRQPTASATIQAPTRTASPPAASTTSRTTSTASPDRQRDRQPARQVSAAALPASSQASARVGFPGPRAEWMTDALISAVVRSMQTAQRAGERYGRPRLMDEHGLTDNKAKTVQAYVAKHGLVRESA